MEAVKGICYHIPKEEKLIEWLKEMGEEFRLYCVLPLPSLNTYFKNTSACS